MEGTVEQPRRVELRIRDQMPHGAYGRPEAIVEQLDRLVADGKISEYTVDVWGESVCTTPTNPIAVATGALETVNEFEAWAAQHGATLEPAFCRRELASIEMEDRREAIVFPIVCLAVYEGDTLAGVFPCTCDEVITVDDCLDALREGSGWIDRLGGLRTTPNGLKG